MNTATVISNTATSSSAVLRLFSSCSYYSKTPIPFYSWTRHNSSINYFTSKIRMHNPSINAAAFFSAAAASEPQPDKPKPQPWARQPGEAVGFEMVDYIAEAEGISMGSISFKALFGKGHIANVPVMLAKPQTFVNASGESVGAIASYYRIPLTQVLVIFDGMDLPFAKLQLLPKGGHGGHNGMKNIINHFKGSRDFPRLRIGIGRGPGKMDPVNFVMRPFNKQEREEVITTVTHYAECHIH